MRSFASFAPSVASSLAIARSESWTNLYILTSSAEEKAACLVDAQADSAKTNPSPNHLMRSALMNFTCSSSCYAIILQKLLHHRTESGYRSICGGNHVRRRRSGLPTTLPDERLIASAAIIGHSSRPKNGYNTPAAIGPAIAL